MINIVREKWLVHIKNDTGRVIDTCNLRLWKSFFFPYLCLKMADFEKRKKLQIIFRADIIKVI